MKVLIVRARYTDPAIRKVAKSLHQEGYDVTLLIWDRSGKRSLSEENNEYKIDFFSLRAPQDKLSAIFFLPIWWAYELFYLFRINPDIIHACDFDTQYPAIIAKIVRNKHLVYTIYDFYANNLPNGKFPKIRNAIRSLIANIEKIGIGFADLLILVDESRYEEVRGAKINKIIYVYNTPEEVDEQKNRNLVKVSDNSFVIFYAGILHESRGLAQIILAIEQVEDVKFLVAGGGPDQYLFKNLNDSLKKKIKFLNWIPYHEVIEYTIDSDCIVAFYNPCFLHNRYASPNKLFESMMCRKPIISNDGTSMANIVREENSGLIVPYGNIEAIKEAIIKLQNDPCLKIELGKNGRNAYEQKYSWKIMNERLLEGYSEISNNE